MTESMSKTVSEYLRVLTEHPDRHVGGPGNQAATRFFAETAAGFGLDVRVLEFDCLEWEYGAASITTGGEVFVAEVGP